MGILIFVCLFLIKYFVASAQGYNSTWMIGYENWVTKAIMTFDSNSYVLTTGPRSIGFEGTEATISDEQGNLLMSSNGTWIANANHDTMMNGSGLNPGPYVNSWPDGLVIPYGNIFLPFPGNSDQYLLIHQTGSPNLTDYPSMELFYSIIDITLDSGLGAVTSKNNSIFVDTLSWGLAACRHGNGRDWWIVAQCDSSSNVYKVLFTENGVLSIEIDSLNYVPFQHGNVAQITFSKDGTKFIQSNYDDPVSRNSNVIISDFDRCSGVFSNAQSIQITSESYLYGLAFSPNGQFVYTCSSNFIFQIDVNTLAVDTVATYDGYISGVPPNCCPTTFFLMYLAANGKIYITSGSSVLHIHEMNYPDSLGISCDVQQHNINLGVFSFRAVPNHPNYYLGAADGTICDSLGLNSLNENSELQQYFRIYPNPSNGTFSISYLLPENISGSFEIFDINGKKAFDSPLPAWSNFQSFNISHLSSGIYNCIITSGKSRVYKKLIIQIK